MGFLDNIVGLFGGGNDPEAAKKKRLKQLIKDVSQNKYSKFYRVKTGELTPLLGKFFFDIYKVIGATQVLLQNAARSQQLKEIIIDAFMDKGLIELKEKLSAAAIQEKALNTPVKDLSAAVKRDLSNFEAAFDNTRINGIDNCYNAIISLINFVSFDFFFVLKKFDSGFIERNFSYQPNFKYIKASDLKEEIKDFLEYSASVEMDWEWKAALGVLKTYKEGMDVVAADQWAKILRILKDVSRSRIFIQIIQHTVSDPLWQFIPKIPDERMADTIIDAKKAEIEGAVDKIQNDKRSAQIDQIAKSIFGSAEVDRLSNYTSKGNDVFFKKGFDGFTKVAGVNYIKAYLLDFFKKGVKELCDLILIRGQWSNIVLSQPISNAFHEMVDLYERLTVFDDSLGEKGEHGARLKQAMLKVDRDKGQGKYIRIILKTVNNNAQRIINSASSNLIVIGKNFKSLLDDMQKKPHELITNWKELESAANFEEPLAKRIADDYKRMYYFVQLLQFFTGPIEEEDNPPASLG